MSVFPFKQINLEDNRVGIELKTGEYSVISSEILQYARHKYIKQLEKNFDTFLKTSQDGMRPEAVKMKIQLICLNTNYSYNPLDNIEVELHQMIYNAQKEYKEYILSHRIGTYDEAKKKVIFESIKTMTDLVKSKAGQEISRRVSDTLKN